MKAWLTVLALAAAVPRPAPASPVADATVVAGATVQAAPGPVPTEANLAELPASLAAGVPRPIGLELPAASMPGLKGLPGPGPAGTAVRAQWDASWASPASMPTPVPMALPAALSMPSDAQSLIALARTLPGAAQVARELRAVPREQRLERLLAMAQDPALQAQMLDAAAELQDQLQTDGPQDAETALATWVQYGLCLFTTLLFALLGIGPAGRRRGLGRVFSGPKPALPPAFAALPARQPQAQAQAQAQPHGPRVRLKVHLSPLNRPLPTTQATARAPQAD